MRPPLVLMRPDRVPELAIFDMLMTELGAVTLQPSKPSSKPGLLICADDAPANDIKIDTITNFLITTVLQMDYISSVINTEEPVLMLVLKMKIN